MAFNVNYSAGGTLEEVKRIGTILSGVIDEIKNIKNVENVDLVGVINTLKEVQKVLSVGTVDLVKTVELLKKIELLEQIDVVKLVETVQLIERVQQVDNILNLENIDNVENVNVVKDIKLVEDVQQVDNVLNLENVNAVEKVNLVDTVTSVDEVKHVASVHGFPQFTKPFNTMVMMNIPAAKGIYEGVFITPDIPVEMVAFTVTCTGYGELDRYNLYCNGELWFKDWYCSEVKEGLFIGSSSIVYYLPPKSELKINFYNDSGTSKICWFGIRMLVDSDVIINDDLTIEMRGK